MSKRRMLLLLVITLTSVSSIAPATAPRVSSSYPQLTMYFFAGYYCCLEDDNIEDDIVASLHIKMDSPYYEKIMNLYTWLVLPNGTEYGYALNIKAYSIYRVIEFNMDLYFYDYASISGDYIVDAIGDLEGDRYYVYSAVIFDPPGGKDGANPEFGWKVY